jgi:xanthine dehydrogenase large subunit
VTDRALFHADNCYFYQDVRLVSKPMMTNTVSNTAFRGFGGPQGMLGGERMIEEVAYALGRDPLEIRKANFYGGETATSRPITRRWKTTSSARSSRSWKPRRTTRRGGRRSSTSTPSPVIRRGIALTPVKFGISFTATWYNQAGALVHVYKDGSIHLNHGGTEMGQGLNTKVAQVLADEFQVDLDTIRITATTTGKVPNTSATAASSGTDLNGMAAANAAQQIKDRLVAFASEKYSVPPEQVVFDSQPCAVGNERWPSAISSSRPIWRGSSFRRQGSTRPRKIHWDRAKAARAGRSTISPMARRSRRSASIR